MLHAEQMEKQQAAAKAKKQRMLEMEAEKKKNIPPTESEIEDKIKANFLQNRVLFKKFSLFNPFPWQSFFFLLK